MPGNYTGYTGPPINGWRGWTQQVLIFVGFWLVVIGGVWVYENVIFDPHYGHDCKPAQYWNGRWYNDDGPLPRQPYDGSYKQAEFIGFAATEDSPIVYPKGNTFCGP